MKRFNQLFDQVADFSNLLRAFYKARKGKRKNANVAVFEAKLEWELLTLKEELQGGTYRPGGYRTFTIRDPKERMISAAPFRDRVVHHALCNIIEPVLDKTFIFDTYANRMGKGTHAGIRRCQQYMRQYKYVLKADIRKYFPSIDHAILLGLIGRKIKCKKTLALCRLIVENTGARLPPRRRLIYPRPTSQRPPDGQSDQSVFCQSLSISTGSFRKGDALRKRICKVCRRLYPVWKQQAGIVVAKRSNFSFFDCPASLDPASGQNPCITYSFGGRVSWAKSVSDASRAFKGKRVPNA